MLDLCHRMVLTDPIQEEWNKHQSRFARTWRVSMMARKKIEVVEGCRASLARRNGSRAPGPTSRVAAIMEKDRHLIEAALATDKRVASLDDRVRKHLQDHRAAVARRCIDLLGKPSNVPDEQSIAWLESGAPPRDRGHSGTFHRDRTDDPWAEAHPSMPHVGRRCRAAANVFTSPLLLPPPQSRQRLLLRPDLIERIALEQLAVFHHVADRARVVDVLERVGRQHDEIGELAGFEAAQVLGVADRLGAVQRGRAEDFQRLPATAGECPHFPVVADPLHLTVAADADVSAGPGDLGRRGGDQRDKHARSCETRASA